MGRRRVLSYAKRIFAIACRNQKFEQRKSLTPRTPRTRREREPLPKSEGVDFTEGKSPHFGFRPSDFGLISFSRAERHQAKMEHEPNRDRKNRNGGQALPGPAEMMGLDRIDRDHEVVAETCMTQK